MENLIKINSNELENLIQKSIHNALTQRSLTDISQLQEVLSVSQAASFLHLSQSTIYSYISRRRIPFVKRNGSVWLLRSKLMEWLHEGEKTTLKNLSQ